MTNKKTKTSTKQSITLIKKTSLLLIIGTAILFTVVGWFSAQYKLNLSVIQYKQAASNLYFIVGYDDDLHIEKHTNKQLHLQTISQHLQVNYPDLTFVVERVTWHRDDNDMYFYISQFINQTIVDETHFPLIVNLNTGTVIDFKDYPLIKSIPISASIDTATAIKTAKKLTKDNYDKIFTSINPIYNIFKRINGYCSLHYDPNTNILYYNISLSHYGYVHVDAQTGQVIDSFFHDGIIYSNI